MLRLWRCSCRDSIEGGAGNSFRVRWATEESSLVAIIENRRCEFVLARGCNSDGSGGDGVGGDVVDADRDGGVVVGQRRVCAATAAEPAL